MVELRPATPDDDAAVLAALADRDRADVGDPTWTREDLVTRWRAIAFEPSRDAVVADADGAVAGYAATFTEGTLAFVHPAFEGRGIGTGLRQWAEALERARGRHVHRQRAAATNDAATALLTAAGYRQVRTVWQFVHPLDRLPTMPEPPEGIVVRALDVEADARAVHATDSAAFAQNADGFEESFEDFCAEHLAAPSLDPAASIVACRGDAVAGFTVCRHLPGDIGYIDLLAVAPGERGRGLGAALVTHALAAFARRGFARAQLETASDNPRAIRLYERAGMRRTHGTGVWEKPIR
jgi:mycothiol synthase